MNDQSMPPLFCGNSMSVKPAGGPAVPLLVELLQTEIRKSKSEVVETPETVGVVVEPVTSELKAGSELFVSHGDDEIVSAPCTPNAMMLPLSMAVLRVAVMVTALSVAAACAHQIS